MSLINDVNTDIEKLDLSKKSLVKFAYTVGGIFTLLSVFLILKNNVSVIAVITGTAGVFLLTGGLLFPLKLRNIYKYWMTIAVLLGWFVSKIILTVLFYFVLMPIGLLAKVFGKQFMNLKFKDGADSYWIKKDNINNKINYEKMF